ncbi:hypothetical protein ONS96_007151 [Cadophora gregata f. sp. sojae]|nr:hypothetical protein ONS96_007151 [Cadophora gregata f. sp. sojae]
MAPSKFSWPFKKLAEDLPQTNQLVAKESDMRPPRQAPEPKPRTQPRPIRTVWTQLILRIISLLISLSALLIAVYVLVGPIKRTWPVVFISTGFTILLNTSEILALLRSRMPSLKVPRLHPIALVVADFLVIGFLIWSFLFLFLDIYFGRRKDPAYMSDAEPFVSVEIWLAGVMGFIHTLLFIFVFIDCCSVRSPNSRVNELSYRRRRMGPSRVGEDVIEMDWG